ncbi:hypothetical protein OsI_22258 [Oryza sativa Indica Group]|uniref:Uncharacterized protein n=2 Tax=Oryza sativa TaxID=4530 RepID=B9FSC1_ORYSJ|nr:hypothetical protein OsI_22258 [Oryza sativa Indica Group]EEE65382.1 hypothetical protein OsJ_20693 [Oryza sativa Japonica Group]
MKITRRSKMKCKRETDVSCIRDSPRRSHHAIALPDSDRGALQTPCLDSRHLLICSTLVREKGRESYESRTRMNTDYGMACTHQSVNTEKQKTPKHAIDLEKHLQKPDLRLRSKESISRGENSRETEHRNHRSDNRVRAKWRRRPLGGKEQRAGGREYGNGARPRAMACLVACTSVRARLNSCKSHPGARLGGNADIDLRYSARLRSCRRGCGDACADASAGQGAVSLLTFLFHLRKLSISSPPLKPSPSNSPPIAWLTTSTTGFELDRSRRSSSGLKLGRPSLVAYLPSLLRTLPSSSWSSPSLSSLTAQSSPC